MAHQPSRIPYRGQEWNRRNLQNRMEDNSQMLLQEINRLNFVLNAERSRCQQEMSRANQLQFDLEETKAKWVRQKCMKEIYINRGKETKRQIERLQKFTDAETLSVAEVSSLVESTKRQKKKKVLQKDYELLKVAQIVNQKKFSSELQSIQQKNITFQEELDRARSSYEELNVKYETDVSAVTQKTETLNEELERERKSHAAQTDKTQQFISNLRAEKDTIRLQMEQEITTLQQTSKDTQMRLKGDLEKMKLLYGDLSSKYETDVVTFRIQADSFQQQLHREVQAHAQTVKTNVEQVNKMKADQESLRQAKAQEMEFLRQSTAEKERVFQTEVQGLKTRLKRQISINDQLSAELKDRDDFSPPKRKRARYEEPNQEQVFIPVFFSKAQFSKETIAQTPNHEPEPMIISQLPGETDTKDVEPEPMNMTQLSEETAPPKNVTQVSYDAVAQTSTKSPSFWKKTRHFLGLRKPESWKMKKNTSNETN